MKQNRFASPAECRPLGGRRGHIGLACILALLLAALPAALAENAEQTSFEQMVLVYMVGSDLEDEGGMASRDISEMLESGFDEESTCILLMAGGSNAWALDIPVAQNCIYRLEDGGLNKLIELPDTSMGDASTMESFLHYASDYADARRSGLILWDHGYGPMEGFGRDTRHADACLTLSELTQALDAAQYRPDWIGFDACLMNSAETASALAPYAGCLIASQETEPGEGWNYSFLGSLTPEMDGGAVGECVVAAYFDHYAAQYAGYEQLMPMLSMSCIDLTRIGAVEAALDALFSQLGADIGDELYSDIVRARLEARGVGTFTTTTDYDLVDLIDCIDRLADLYPEDCARARAAVEDCILVNRSNVERLGGISVYFPYNNIPLFLSRWGSTGEAIGCSEGYRSFLHDYALLWLQDRLQAWRTDAPATDDCWSLPLTDDQLAGFASARYVVLEKLADDSEALRPIFYGYDLQPGAGGLTAAFDGRILYAVSGESIVPVIAQKRGEDAGFDYYHCSVTLERGSFDDGDYELRPVVLQLVCDRQSGQYRLTGLIDSRDSGLSTGKQSLRLDDWQRLRSVSEGSYPSMDAGGSILPLEDWRRDTKYYGYSMDITQGLSFELRTPVRQPDAFGDYYLLIEATGTRGECIASRLTPIEIETAPADAEAPVESLRCRYYGAPLTLVDDEAVQIRLDGLSWQDRFSMDLTIENRLENGVSVDLQAIALNGITVENLYLDFFESLSAGESVRTSIDDGSDAALVQAGVGDPVTDIDLLLCVQSAAGGQCSYRAVHIDCNVPYAGAARAILPPVSRYDGPEGVLWEDETLSVAYRAVLESTSRFTLRLHVENRSDRFLTLSTDSLAVNGCALTDYSNLCLLPGSSAQFDLALDYAALWRAGVSPVEEILLRLIACDRISGAALCTTDEIRIPLRRRGETIFLNESGLQLGFEVESASGVLANFSRFVYINARNDSRSAMQVNFTDIRINGTRIRDSLLKVPAQRQLQQSPLLLSLDGDVPSGEVTSVVADVEIWNLDRNIRLAALDDVVFFDAAQVTP